MRFWLIEHIEHEDLADCLFHGAREGVRERSISGKRILNNHIVLRKQSVLQLSMLWALHRLFAGRSCQ